MTGKSYAKTRVVLSDKLLSPLANRKSFNDAAISFRRSVSNSVASPRLNADISVKALNGNPSKGDTDGKKRTNKGGIPGVETYAGGYRYNPKQKWEPGKVLKIHSSYHSRMNQRVQTPNWGWVDDEKAELPDNKPRPYIVKKKYKVNPRNGEPIDGSTIELSPFTATGAEPPESFGTKQLPGKTIGQIMRGASLLQTAARAVGVVTDSDGKLRCPPGTPAANQFTDAMGSNCFGMTASEIYGLAQRVASSAGELINDVSHGDGLASGGRRQKRGGLLNTLSSWRTLIGDAMEKASEIPWMSTGRENIQPSDWQIDELPDDFGWFKDGAKRGRRNLRDMRKRLGSMLEVYGIEQDENDFDQNSSIIKLFERMRQDGIVTTEFRGRPQTKEEWLQQAYATLVAKFGQERLNKLSDRQLNELMQKEIDLQFEMERAMLSEVLNSYIEMPAHMRTVRYIDWTPNYRMGNNNEASAVWDVGDGGYTKININLPRISHSAQEYLPELLENERARLEAAGGGSEAENAAALHDFIVSSYVYSKQTAALIGGTESFARHIMAHEISHTVQLNALVGAIADEIAKSGKIRFFDDATGKWTSISASSISDLTNGELNMIMAQIILREDGVKKIIPSLQKVIDDANKMRWLAGKYMDDVTDKSAMHQTLEIMAELAALRKQGIIHGPDVDDALAWMDEYVDTRFVDERGMSDAEEVSRFIDLVTYAQANTPREVSEIFKNNPVMTEERIYRESKATKLRDIALIDNEDELIDLIADKEFEIEQLSEQVQANPDDTELGRQLKDAKDELSLAKQRWREMNPGTDNLVLQEKVKRNRDEKDKLNPAELKKRNDKRDLESMRKSAEDASEEDIVNTIAYMKKKLEDKNLSEASKEKIRKYIDIYRKAFTKKKRESGDSRNTQAIAKELDKRVRDKINPPKPRIEETEPEASSNPATPKTKGKKPKPIKKPKNEASVTRHTEAEREKLFTESAAHERMALVELSDPDGKPIAEILDPEKRVEAIEKIRTANDSVISAGLEPDPTSHLQGSVEQQLENILMPVLDVLERSELENSVEVEAVINLTEDQISGADGELISVDGMISGRLIDGQRGPSASPRGDKNPENGKVAHKVVIQAEAGQKGYYPHWSDSSTKKPAGYQQKVVLPPGKLEIVDRIQNPDGSTTLVARVVEQKNTEEILDGILSGPDSQDIPAGARVEIQRSVNKHIIDRRKRGLSRQQQTPQDEKERIETENDLSFDVVNNENGSFGTQLDEDYVESSDIDPESPDSSDAEVFGPKQTREERRKERIKEIKEVSEDLVDVANSGEANEELGISPEDIDPEVLKILEESTPEEIEQILADEAAKIHEDMDSRPRDVTDEEGLEEIINDEPKPSAVPSFLPQRRPSSNESAESSGGPQIQPPQPPGDVDPETGEIMPEQESTRPTLDQRITPGIVYKSKYRKQRKEPTTRVMAVLRENKQLNDAMNEVQGMITGGPYAYQGRRTESGIWLEARALEAFGTANLDELTAEQIAWLADIAVYESNRLKPPDRSTKDREVRDNMSRALSFLASALEDYLDLMYIQANGKAPYPNGDWQILSMIPRPGESMRPGPITPGLDGSYWDTPDDMPPARRIVSPAAPRSEQSISSSLDRDARRLASILGSSMADSFGAGTYNIDYIMDFNNATASELSDAANEMELYIPFMRDISPEAAELAEKMVDDVFELSKLRDGGLASGGLRGKISSRVARKLVGPLVDRLDVDDETKERIKIVADVVAMTASKGPTGAVVSIATEAARRGGREVAELALRKLVDSGKITEEQSRIAMNAVDKVAPEGLPDPVKEMLIDGYKVVDKFVDEKVLTDENKERISRATDEAKERLSNSAEATRDAVGDAAKLAKEKTKRGLAKLKERKQQTQEVKSVDDAIFEVFSEPDNDPFSSPPSPSEAVSIVSAFDDPFADSMTTTNTGNEQQIQQREKPRFIRRLRRDSFREENQSQTPAQSGADSFDFDPFAGLSSGGRSSDGLASGRRARRMERVGRPDNRSTGSPYGNPSQASAYIPVTPDDVPEFIRSNPYSRKAKKGGGKKILKIVQKAGIDWGKQGQLREQIDEAISESPAIKKLVEDFGMPPIFALDEFPQPGPIGVINERWGPVVGVYLPELGIIAVPSGDVGNRQRRESQKKTLRHEMTHAFHAMARARDESARELMQNYINEQVLKIKDLASRRGVSPHDVAMAANSRDDIEAQIAFSGLTPEQRQEALRISEYAATNLLEFIAEALAFASSTNPVEREKVSDNALKIIAPYLGMSYAKILSIFGR